MPDGRFMLLQGFGCCVAQDQDVCTEEGHPTAMAAQNHDLGWGWQVSPSVGRFHHHYVIGAVLYLLKQVVVCMLFLISF
jgi:hypothetical protein